MLHKYTANKAKEDLLAIDASIAMEYNSGRVETWWMDWLLTEQSKYMNIIKQEEERNGII